MQTIEQMWEDIFRYIGDDPEREGLRGTPHRIRKSWDHLFSGYKMKPEDVLKAEFREGACDEMVILKDIEFYSTCEHHFLPFFGSVSFGYIPDGKVVGVSKIARLVEVFSRRLQIQERMTTHIADSFVSIIKPKGVMVVVKAQHFCMTSRGVEKKNSIMITNAIRGIFRDDVAARMEFLSTIKDV